MSGAAQFYITTLLVYVGVATMACWGLNLQFGYGGIISFAFIVFQAVGAYTAGVLALGPSPPGNFQQYLGAGPLPFPLTILVAGLAGGVLALLLGPITLRRLRADYEAMVMLVVSLIATAVATDTKLVNGAAGIANVPQPLATSFHMSPLSYQWFYVALTAVICAGVYWGVHRLTNAPLGRALRAVRENEHAASAVGKNVFHLRMIAFVAGGIVGAISGAVLVLFISTWAPSGWLYPETFVYFTAVIVGGTANDLGVMIGAVLVPVAFLEGARFLPPIVNPTFIDSMQWVVIGLLAMIFLWFRPRGLVPERRRRFSLPPGRTAPVSVLARDTVAGSQAVLGPEDHSARLERMLDVSDVHRSFGGVRAVDGVSFQIPSGSTIGLIGPNGAGKSSVLSMIAGALKPDRGSIRFGDKPIAGKPPHWIAREGIIRTFQLSSEFARLTVLENLMVAAARQRGESLIGCLIGKRAWRHQEGELIEQAHSILAWFDLLPKANEYAGNLSGGQKRLLEIMRALMADPAVLLLDEPLAGVSPLMATEVEQRIFALREKGMSILIVEHELSVVERLCDQVVVMALGRVLAQGSMDSLRRNKEVVDAYLAG